MIERMAKVEILGLKDLALDAIDVIHDQGTLHIEDLSERIGLMDSKRVTRMEMDPEFAEHEARLRVLRERVSEMIRELNISTDITTREAVRSEYRTLYSDNLDLMTGRIERILNEVEKSSKDPVEKKADLMVELSRLEKYGPIMAKVQPLTEKVAKMGDMASVALVIERKYRAILGYLNEEISKLADGECDIISADVDEESTAALVIFNRKHLKQVHDFLAVQDVNQVRLPSDLAKKPLDEALEEINRRIAEIPEELKKIDSKLEAATEKYAPKLLAARDAIHDRMDTMEAMPKFGQTDQVFIISGWMPEDRVEPLEEALAEKFGNKVMATVVDIREEHVEEETPVLLRNKPFVRYFEIIYLLSKYPKYGTVDPTVIFAIFFPIFFGLMVGDIGYGIVIMALGWFVHRKWCERPLANMAGFILTTGGFWTVVFGILYMEFFGDLLMRWTGVLENHHVHYLLGSKGSYFKFPIDRLEGFTFMLLVTCAIGFIHIALGLIIGIVNGARERNMKHVIEKAGTLAALTGMVLVIAKLIFAWMPVFSAIIGVAMFIGGIVAAGVGAGMGGVVEAIVGAGNILSYSRLIAIGLASVIMAQVANDLTRELWGGVFGVLMGIIMAVLLHTLNIVIGMFSPSIHALRLHLVESFGKFFEPAKYKYEPFKKTGGEE